MTRPITSLTHIHSAHIQFTCIRHLYGTILRAQLCANHWSSWRAEDITIANINTEYCSLGTLGSRFTNECFFASAFCVHSFIPEIITSHSLMHCSASFVNILNTLRVCLFPVTFFDIGPSSLRCAEKDAKVKAVPAKRVENGPPPKLSALPNGSSDAGAGFPNANASAAAAGGSGFGSSSSSGARKPDAAPSAPQPLRDGKRALTNGASVPSAPSTGARSAAGASLNSGGVGANNKTPAAKATRLSLLDEDDDAARPQGGGKSFLKKDAKEVSCNACLSKESERCRVCVHEYSIRRHCAIEARRPRWTRHFGIDFPEHQQRREDPTQQLCASTRLLTTF